MEHITITRAQLEAWAGRPLSDGEVDTLDDAIPNSSIPEAVGVIVAHMETPTREERARDLSPGSIFSEIGMYEWRRVFELDFAGDTVIVLDHNGDTVAIDGDTVVEVIDA